MKKFNKSKVLKLLYDEYNVKTRSELVNAIDMSDKDMNSKINHLNKLIKCSSGKTRILSKSNDLKDLNLLYKNYGVDNKRDLLDGIQNNKEKKANTRLRHVNKLEKILDKKERQAITEVKEELSKKDKLNTQIRDRLKEKYGVKKYSNLKETIKESKHKHNVERVNRRDIPVEDSKFNYKNYSSYIDFKVNAKDKDNNRNFTVGLTEHETNKFNNFKTNFEKYEFMNDLFFSNMTANRYLELEDGQEDYNIVDIYRIRL